MSSTVNVSSRPRRHSAVRLLGVGATVIAMTASLLMVPAVAAAGDGKEPQLSQFTQPYGGVAGGKVK